MADQQVPKIGDRFSYRYRRVMTTFEVISEVVSKAKGSKWRCQAVDGKFKGLKADFEQEQTLMLIGSFLHSGAVSV